MSPPRKARQLAHCGLLAAVVAAAPSGAAPPPADFYRGMALGLFSRGDPAYIRGQIDELAALGVDAVSLVVPKATPDIGSVEFRDDPLATPSEAALVEAARRAHSRGMRVMLFPVVYVQTLGDGEWRGTLHPSDWDAWFRAYGDVILSYARLAEAERIELLSVGSELCSTEFQEARWRGLIAAVRGVYHGRILYSANWDHFDAIGFGDALDYLGVNAYYQLARGAHPAAEDLRAGWGPPRERLVGWSRRQGRPLLFTEVGYPSREGAADDPWDYTADRPADLEVQRRCYRAFAEAWSGVPELAGAFFYLWWGEGGPGDRDYTPRHKPAEAELARWFGGAAGAATPAAVRAGEGGR